MNMLNTSAAILFVCSCAANAGEPASPFPQYGYSAIEFTEYQNRVRIIVNANSTGEPIEFDAISVTMTADSGFLVGRIFIDEEGQVALETIPRHDESIVVDFEAASLVESYLD